MKVLVTGATGFVGGELLRRLARQARPVVCLVRASSDAAARERGAATSRALKLPPAARVEWLAGDLERPALGLEPATFQRLAGEVSEIFHCAASTDFDLPLDDAIKTNVEGARRVGELASAAHARGGLQRLVHVSTAYVSGRARGAVTADNLPPDDPALFRNTYERTKAMAERLLRELAEREGIPLTILRPSIVTGDSRTGWTSNWNVLYFPFRMIAWRKSPFISCGRGALLDCVPVDWVADATLALGRRPDTAGRTLHLTAGEDAPTVRRMFQDMCAAVRRREGPGARIRTRLLGPVLWFIVTTLLRLFGSEHTRKALSGLSTYVEYTCVRTRFDVRRETALLAEEGVTFPAAAEFLPRVLDYALEENFGRPRPVPQKRPTPLAAALQSATGTIADALKSGVIAPDGLAA